MQRSGIHLRTALLALLALVTACNPQQMAKESGARKRLSIATGGTGGVYYPYGGGIAKVISEHIPNVEATAEVTAASVDNLKFIRDHKADIAFTTADTLADGINGTGAFKDNKLPIRAIANLYRNYTHVVTLASSPIKTIKDLKGKVVSLGSPGSGTQVTGMRVLKAYGIDPASDIKQQALGVSESVDALKDGKIDAFFWNGGLPTAAILDLSHTSGITIRVISNDSVLSNLQDTYGKSLYLPGVVPKSVYAGMEGDAGVISIPNLLVVHADMDANLVYEITKALFENQAEIVAIHPEASNLTLATAVVGSPAEFHPGAIRYYEEQKAWTK
jgi:uncharacterized protein